jgi:hypothetical protein
MRTMSSFHTRSKAYIASSSLKRTPVGSNGAMSSINMAR